MIRSLSVGLCGGILAVSLGCQESSWPKRTPLSPESAAALDEIAARQRASNEIASGAFQGESWTIGSIPWNSTILPVLSPDARWIATSTGRTPSTASQLALPGSTIEIWEVLPTRTGLRRTVTLTEPLILSDSADDEGFLVESPRQNGSRWIGKVDWRTGDLTWLVRGDLVNAMPSVGPRGRLSWCVRAQSESAFSLAVRFPSGEEFALDADDGEWLLPLWSARSTRLSAWRLSHDGVLRLVSLNGESPDTLAQNAKQVLIMNGANRWDAVHATANRTAVQGLQAPPVEEVVFYHPIDQRVTVWMPTGINSDRVVPLASGSIDAVHDTQGNFLLTMPAGLHWQDLSDLRRIVRIDHIPVFARPTTDPMRPYILLDPGSEAVHLRGMRPRASQANAD